MNEQPETWTPKLRFPEFKDAPVWISRRIGTMLLESRVPAAQSDPLRRITVRLHSQGVEPRGVRGTESGDATIHFTRRAGQFIYGKQNIHKGALGVIPASLDGFQTSQDLPAFDFADTVDPAWFVYSVGREQFYTALEHLMTGTGSKRLKEETFQAIGLPTPSLQEQRKIVECLTSLDELLAAEARKLEALRSHKRGLIQRLFPREGEPCPHLRFPAFRKAGEWETRPLGDVAENLDSKRVPITEKDRRKGEIPYYGASGIVDYVEGYIFDEDLLCISEDGANLLARTYPIAFSISGKTWVNNHAHVLRFDDRARQTLVEVYLNTINLGDFITGIAQPKLNRGMLETIPIPLPPEPAEQQRIATCLSSLDALIAAASRTLDGLRAHRKGLMQFLFPSPEGA